tara:strand:+ start:1869 stop:5357 length:3489 start_codon:yes stop_codon:yes gene_type:complete
MFNKGPFKIFAKLRGHNYDPGNSAESTSEPEESNVADYGSKYDYDTLVPHIRTNDAAIASLMALNKAANFSEDDKNAVREFLEENKNKITEFFETSEIDFSDDSVIFNTEKSDNLALWIKDKLAEEDLAEPIKKFLENTDVETTLGNWITAGQEPDILMHKEYEDDEKKAISDFLDQQKGSIFKIINNPNIDIKQRLKELNDWVNKIIDDIAQPALVHNFVKNPAVLNSLQKDAIKHEIAIDFKKAYASGESIVPKEIISGKYDQIKSPNNEASKALAEQLKLTPHELANMRKPMWALIKERDKLISKRVEGLREKLTEKESKQEGIEEEIEQKATEEWQEYIENLSSTGSSTFKKAAGKNPYSDHSAPDKAIPAAKKVWFYQGIAQFHLSNWGWRREKNIKNDETGKKLERSKFINMNIHTYNVASRWIPLLPQIKPVHVLHKSLPRMFTGKIFGKALYDDIDKSIEASGLIDPIKQLQDTIKDIAFKIEKNELYYDKSIDDKKTAKELIIEAFDDFADQYHTQLLGLEFNSKKRMDELEAIKPEAKYSGREGFVEETKESALNFAQDINWMAISLARKGELNELMQELLTVAEKKKGNRKNLATAIEAGIEDRLSRLGSLPEMRLAGQYGDPEKGIPAPTQNKFNALEQTLDVGMYNRETRFIKTRKMNNSELVMGDIVRFHEGLPLAQTEAGTKIQWNVEDGKQYVGLLDLLYESGMDHHAGIAIRLSVMRMGQRADDTFSKSLVGACLDGMAKYETSQPHRAQFYNSLINVANNLPDSPRKYGPRNMWNKMFPIAEFLSIGWAYAGENEKSPNTWKNTLFKAPWAVLSANPMVFMPTPGIPATEMFYNWQNNRTNRRRAYFSGKVTEKKLTPSAYGELETLVVSDKNLVAEKDIEKKRKRKVKNPETKKKEWKEETYIAVRAGDPLKGWERKKQQFKNVAGRLTRDAIVNPAKFLLTGGISGSKHIAFASLLAAEITTLGLVGKNLVTADFEAFTDPSEYSTILKAGTFAPRFAQDQTIFRVYNGITDPDEPMTAAKFWGNEAIPLVMNASGATIDWVSNINTDDINVDGLKDQFGKFGKGGAEDKPEEIPEALRVTPQDLDENYQGFELEHNYSSNGSANSSQFGAAASGQTNQIPNTGTTTGDNSDTEDEYYLDFE